MGLFNMGIDRRIENRENSALLPHLIFQSNNERVIIMDKKQVPWNKGLKNCYSSETREKMCQSKIGIKLSDSHKKNISKGCKGKNIGITPWNKGETNCYSKESLIKMSKSAKGKIISQEQRKKISRSVSIVQLEKNRRKNKKYCDEFYDYEYKNDIRKQYCEHCGMSRNLSYKLFGVNLSLHHDKGNYNCAPNDVKTLCCSCHTKFHKKKE